MLYNLREVHRPRDLDEAIQLLQRADVRTVPLAGGTALVGQRAGEVEAVVDLSDLGLDSIEFENGLLRLGATATLQSIVEELDDTYGGLLAGAAHRMAGWNLRNAATVGGTLAAGLIHSPLSVVLAALGAEVAVTGQDERIPWPAELDLSGRLITAVTVPVYKTDVGTAYEQVGRTPADLPIVSAAGVAREVEEGMISARVVVGGLLAGALKVLDVGIERSAPDISAVEAIADGLDDAALESSYLGTPAYRRAVAPVLARRALTAALAAIGYEVE